MSEKSIAYHDYILKRLGFKSEYLEEYLIHLVNRPECEFKTEDGRTYYDIMPFLLKEYELKGNKAFKQAKRNSDYISATDLANFTFCPVAYSISKTFEIEPSEEAKKGTQLHERQRLINNLKSTPPFSNNKNKDFFQEIHNSKIVYSGHSDDNNSEKYFVNDQIGFVGQPDYVFENLKGENFIVEEKFTNANQVTKDENQTTFFKNHRVQLESYIYLLKQFNAKYGYLVYWVYSFNDYRPSVECKVLKIYKNQGITELLDTAINQIKTFNSEKSLDISKELLKPKKCANCAYSQCCGHKTKRIDKVSIPYKKEYHNLYYAEYPEILNRYFLLLVEINKRGYVINNFKTLNSAENARDRTVLQIQNHAQDIGILVNIYKDYRKYIILEEAPYIKNYNSVEFFTDEFYIIQSIEDKNYKIHIIEMTNRKAFDDFGKERTE